MTTKKIALSTLAAAVLAAGFSAAAPTAAEASPYYVVHKPYPTYGHPFHGGAIAAGVFGGLALGAIAASTAVAAPVVPVYEARCFFERRTFTNRHGKLYDRLVRVCE